MFLKTLATSSVVIFFSVLFLNLPGSPGSETTAAVQCLPSPLRVDCHPEIGANEERCLARGCLWCEAENEAPEGTPWCFTSPNYGYRMIGSEYETPVGIRVNLSRVSTNQSYFGNDFDDIVADFEFYEEAHLRIKVNSKSKQC